MHLLAADYREEFLATPQLIRFEHADGQNYKRPTLLLKASTIVLKYVALNVPLNFVFATVNNRLIYALRINDDSSGPYTLWSIVEHEREKAALLHLMKVGKFPIFLFNETAINVSWAEGEISPTSRTGELIQSASLEPFDYDSLQPYVVSVLDQFDEELTPDHHIETAKIDIVTEWHELYNNFITSHGSSSPINLFHDDEGGQQEQLAIWLTDNLDPLHVYSSPRVPKGDSTQELTDVLLSHAHGSFLIESKALTIFGRKNLPDRAKLMRNMSRHLTKSISQLKGAIRSLKREIPVTDANGLGLAVERQAYTCYCIDSRF